MIPGDRRRASESGCALVCGFDCPPGHQLQRVPAVAAPARL